MIPAVGQGALAIECRADDTEMLEMLAPINGKLHAMLLMGNAGFLRQLNGGCKCLWGYMVLSIKVN